MFIYDNKDNIEDSITYSDNKSLKDIQIEAYNMGFNLIIHYHTKNKFYLHKIKNISQQKLIDNYTHSTHTNTVFNSYVLNPNA